MAFRAALLGYSNSGKTYSKSFIKEGEKCVVIRPSSKFSMITTSKGEPLKEMKVTFKSSKSPTGEVTISSYGEDNKSFLNQISIFVKAKLKGDETPPMKFEGNIITCEDVNKLAIAQKFVSLFMPNINKIMLNDFTHWISYIITTNTFKNSKGYERFWDLAADSLSNAILVSDKLRSDIIVYSEYHISKDDPESLDINVPMGNMLKDKFMPLTYYDCTMVTFVLPYGDYKEEDRHKFIVVKKGEFPGRGMGLFNDIAVDGMIPNNLQIVDERLRKRMGV